MILIVCVDDAMGMAFNQRRQSRDRILNQRLLELTRGKRLWMGRDSYALFESAQPGHVVVDDACLEHTPQGDYCFVEQQSVKAYEPRVEAVLLCRWNRRYPSDVTLDLPLKEHGWSGTLLEEFPGSSHEKITLEKWRK